MNQFSMDLASHPALRMDSRLGTGDKIRSAGSPMGVVRSAWPFLVKAQRKPEPAETGNTDTCSGFVS
ncbi:hypothetical protein [Polaromonas sp.]|uniref:hypothetical protein n=1 Tax=Polaromonas sp. TaxID=1869339 RepID=UPI003C954807